MAWRSRWGGGRYGYEFWRWRPYVPAHERRANARRAIAVLEKKEKRKACPVEIEGRTIAQTFWGKAWCDNLERYSDFENRLPRGRTYVRNGSVIDLQIAPRKVTALVSGSEIYKVSVDFDPLKKAAWRRIQEQCAGKIDSMVELLQGRVSDAVMEILTAPDTGLFPAPKEIHLDCSCPDWAELCKHVAAVLYGVGARLDDCPELLFVLRDVDPTELVSKVTAQAARVASPAEGETLEAKEMEQIFGIEIDPSSAAQSETAAERSPVGEGHAAGRRAPRKRTVDRAPRPGQERRGSVSEGETAWPEDLAARRERLQKHFLASDTLTNAQYRELFRIDRRDATRELGRLAALGALIQRGAKRGAHYIAGVELC